jgi:hypothetical protein
VDVSRHRNSTDVPIAASQPLETAPSRHAASSSLGPSGSGAFEGLGRQVDVRCPNGDQRTRVTDMFFQVSRRSTAVTPQHEAAHEAQEQGRPEARALDASYRFVARA